MAASRGRRAGAKAGAGGAGGGAVPGSVRPETEAAALAAALAEFSTFGFKRTSMESVARRAGLSRATLYKRWRTKDELFRSLVADLHDRQVDAMRQTAEGAAGNLPQRLLAVIEARFVPWVELTSGSPHAAELYDVHSRQCGDLARASQERSEAVLARIVAEAARAGEIDLRPSGLGAADVASALFDAAHGAKGEDPGSMTVPEYRRRLRRLVTLACTGLGVREAPSTSRRRAGPSGSP